MKSIYLIRHAEAEHHVLSITGGWTDTSLTARGVEQSELLASRLKRLLVDQPIRFGSSNLKRSIETASIISRELGVKFDIYPELTDLNNGIAAGKTHDQARTLALPFSEPAVDWQPYPGAESWRQFYQRVYRFMEQLPTTPEEILVLVSHAATMHVIIDWWLEIPVESPTHFESAPASLSILGINRWGEHSLEKLNDTSHLVAAGWDI